MSPKKFGSQCRKLTKKRLESEYKASLQWKKWLSPSQDEADRNISQEGEGAPSSVGESPCTLNDSEISEPDSSRDCS